MKIKQLVSAISLSLLAAGHVSAAKYTLTELPTDTVAKNNFGSAISEAGEVGVTGAAPYNPPLDFSLFNFDDENLQESLKDVEAARAGNPITEDYLTLFNTVNGQEENVFFQQLGDNIAFVVDNGEKTEVIGFDQIDPETGNLTRSVDTIITDLGLSNVVTGIGNGPYRKLNYVNNNDQDVTYFINDFIKRGFVQINGQTIPLLPVDDTLGGVTAALGVNRSNQVAGFTSIRVTDSMATLIESCNDDTSRGDEPVEGCLQELRKKANESAFERRGMIWTIGDDGTVVDSRQLGLLVQPEADDTRIYFSAANAINDNGIAVGSSLDYYRGNTESLREFAAIFDGDTVTGITDHEEFYFSTATDINNSNVVVGYALKGINGFERSKFFVHDMATGTTTYPVDFFSSSSSIARAINDNGLVVGEGEVETDSSSTRRRAGFLYDVNTGTFENLNDLLPCDLDYDIVQATDINENNEISATASVFVQARDIRGDLMTDENGDPIMENKVVAVKLTPVPGGQIDACQSEPDEPFERKGGSLWWMLLAFVLVPFKKFRTAH